MQYTRLGTTGTTVSRICLGMMTYGSKSTREWALEEAEARPLIKKAVDLGFTFFDTADVYSTGVSEEITGRALKDYAPPREEIVVATKVHGVMGNGTNMRGLSRKHILQAVDASLSRLGMDYVDLYQIHRFDPATPMEETLEALTDVVKAGKAFYIGASSMYAWQFAQYLALADRLGLSRFVTMQNHYNLLYREEEREMLPLCRKEGIGVIPWSPLARGLLTRPRQGKRRNAARQDRRIWPQPLQARRRRQRGDRQGHRDRQKARRAECAGGARLAPGATRRHRADHRCQQGVALDDAVAALDVKLEADELKALAELYVPHAVVGHQ